MSNILMCCLGNKLYLNFTVSQKINTSSVMNNISPLRWCWWWPLPGGVPSPHWGGFCQMLSSEEYTHPVRRAINMMVELQTYQPWHKSSAPIVLAICIKYVSVSSKTQSSIVLRWGVLDHCLLGRAWASPTLVWLHCARVCIYACLFVCLYQPLTVNFK